MNGSPQQEPTSRLQIVPDAPANVPVFDCRLILRPLDNGRVLGRCANLQMESFEASTERDVLMRLSKDFRRIVETCRADESPIPWIEPPLSPENGEVLRFLPVHL